LRLNFALSCIPHTSHSALHLAIIHNQQEVVVQLLDVLPQLPPSETPVVDCLNNFKQVGGVAVHNTVYLIAGNICGVQISFLLFSVYQNENLTNETYI